LVLLIVLVVGVRHGGGVGVCGNCSSQEQVGWRLTGSAGSRGAMEDGGRHKNRADARKLYTCVCGWEIRIQQRAHTGLVK
jgi:hypothetical protein